MKLNPELFVLPEEGKGTYILYLPESGRFSKGVGGGMIKALKEIDFTKQVKNLDAKAIRQLRERKILLTNEEFDKIKEAREKSQKKFIEQAYKPTSVTLMPTWDCNLRCVYCYSRGGEDIGEDMSVDVARASIDTIVKNANELNSNKVRLSFHGGGEPFYPRTLPLVKDSVKYFRDIVKQNGLKGEITSATNAVLPKETLDYIVNNFDSVNISLDGPEDIQNLQRPTAGGGKSFDSVMRSIEYFNKNKFHFGLRSTVTDYGVRRIPEIVEFLNGVAPQNKRFHLESLFECGRCFSFSDELIPAHKRAPSAEDFIEYMIKGKEIGKKLGVDIFCSASSIENISNRFCGAAGTNFFVTPSGKVTTCLEVSREEDSMAGIFIIGNYNPSTNQFDLDQNKINYLKSRTVESIENCTDCFAKYNCSGDCLAKVCAQSGNLFDASNNVRCEINRALLKYELEKK